MVPLSTPLETGQTVEIITSLHQRPHRDWLDFVKSARARSCIRRALREEAFNQSVRLGRDMVDRDQTETFMATIKVTGKDRTNLLSDMTQVMSNLGVPIVGASIETRREEIDNQFQVEIKNTDHLEELLQYLRKVPNITSAYRLEDSPESSS